MKRKRQSTRQPLRPAKSSSGGSPSRLLPSGYGELLDELKARVRAAQIKAAVAANRELIHLYWDIGRLIVERQQKEGWGQGVIERLAGDIQRAFPGLTGFSRSNVFRMRAFYLAYQSAGEIVAQPVRQLSSAKVPQALGQISRQKVAQPVRQLSGPPLRDALARIPWGTTSC
jgi:hypothetical protein